MSVIALKLDSAAVDINDVVVVVVVGVAVVFVTNDVGSEGCVVANSISNEAVASLTGD